MKTITIELTKKQVNALKPLLDEAASCRIDQQGIITGQAGLFWDGVYRAKFGFVPHDSALALVAVLKGIDL
jgi:hypothetical protein